MKFLSDSVPEQRNRIALVTGSNSGIGLETARTLAKKGATVVMACRNLDKGRAAQQSVKESAPNATVDLMQLDLSDIASVKKFAAEFKKKYKKLDLLINNAGIMAVPFAKTTQGFETQFGTNHIGHFVLTGELLDLMKDVDGSRIVVLSSLVHRQGKIDFENLNAEKAYSRSGAYAQSKLANLLFSFELERRLRKANAKTIAVAAHPGWTITNLQAHVPLVGLINPIFGQKPPQGALPSLYAATADGVKGGEYFGPGGILELQGSPKKVKASKRAHDIESAARLWQVSEKLTGSSYLN